MAGQRGGGRQEKRREEEGGYSAESGPCVWGGGAPGTLGSQSWPFHLLATGALGKSLDLSDPLGAQLYDESRVPGPQVCGGYE